MERKSNTRALVLGGATMIVALSSIIYYYKFRNSIDAEKFIKQVRSETKPGLDSLQAAFNYDDHLNFRIKEYIDNGYFDRAKRLLDSLPAFEKNIMIPIYKGMIFEKRKDYSNAISEYNLSLSDTETPLAYEKRAGVYLKLHQANEALKDYKKAFSYNFDYSFHVAESFELLKEKDSALKYYKIYLEHYPMDSVSQQRVLSLNN